MKSACSKPALLTIVLLSVATATAFLLRASAGSVNPSELSQSDEPPLQSAQALPPAARPVREVATNADSRPLLEALGALTAAHCYQAYFNMGLVADARA